MVDHKHNWSVSDLSDLARPVCSLLFLLFLLFVVGVSREHFRWSTVRIRKNQNHNLQFFFLNMVIKLGGPSALLHFFCLYVSKWFGHFLVILLVTFILEFIQFLVWFSIYLIMSFSCTLVSFWLVIVFAAFLQFWHIFFSELFFLLLQFAIVC